MRHFIFVLGMLAVVPLSAQAPVRPLPPFAVVDAGGVRVDSTAIAPGRVVLVYVKADCRPCEQLLGTLARVGGESLAQHLVLLVGGDVDAASALAARAVPQELRGAAWYADRDGAAWTALAIKGLPLTLGVDGEEIAWTMSGTQDRRLLESVIRSWVGGPGGQE